MQDKKKTKAVEIHRLPDEDIPTSDDSGQSQLFLFKSLRVNLNHNQGHPYK